MTRTTQDKDLNRDPITGESGSHPVGVGLGAAGGAALGAAVGSAAGPVGTAAGSLTGAVLGIVAGGIAGGAVGKGIAELVNPTEEENYWRDNYTSRPYVPQGARFEDYQPAYRYGYESRAKYSDRAFDDAENDLRGDWESFRGQSPLTWDQARDAVRDSYDRTGNVYTERSQRARITEPA